MGYFHTRSSNSKLSRAFTMGLRDCYTNIYLNTQTNTFVRHRNVYPEWESNPTTLGIARVTSQLLCDPALRSMS